MSAATAADAGPITRSKALDDSLARAHQLAVAQGHAAVTLEHLLFALQDDPDGQAILASSGVNRDGLAADVSGFVGRLSETAAAAPGAAPQPGPDLLRILQLATMAARQSQRRLMDGAIVLAAIIGDGNSPAAGMLKAQGLTFDAVIQVIAQQGLPRQAQVAAAAPPPPPPSLPPPAAPLPAATRPSRPSDQTNADAMLADVRARIKQSEPATVPIKPPPQKAIRVASAPELAPAPAAPSTPPPEMPRAQANDAVRAGAPSEPPEPAEQGASSQQSSSPPEQMPPLAAQPSAPPPQTRIQPPPIVAPPASIPEVATSQTAPGLASLRRPTAAAIAPPPLPAAPPPLPPTSHPAPVPPPSRAPPPLPTAQTYGRSPPPPASPPPPEPPSSPQTSARPPMGHTAPSMAAQNHPAPASLPPAAMMPVASQPTYAPPPSHQAPPLQPPPPPQHPSIAANAQLQPQPLQLGPSLQIDIVAAAAGLPAVMRIGTPVLVEVRIPRDQIDVPRRRNAHMIAAGSEPPIYRVVSVRLGTGGISGIAIEPRSPETIWIGMGRDVDAHDFVWQFVVTPTRAGRFAVSLGVAGRTVSPYGVAGDGTPVSETFAVVVKRQAGSRFKRLLGWTFVFALGAATAAVAGGPIVAAVKLLLGRWIK